MRRVERSSRSRGAAIAIAIAVGLVSPSGGLTAASPALGAAASSAAPVFVVTSDADLPDQAADGACLASNGRCTLRAAVAEAARAVAAPTIVLPAGTFRLTGGPGDNAGDLDLTRPMHLVGTASPPGARATTISAEQADRVVEVSALGVIIEGVVLTGGAARNGAGAYVRAGASLELRDTTVQANHAADQGGGIDNAGTLTVTRSALLRNSAVKKGGGLHNGGTATVTNSTVHGNSSSAGGGIVTSGRASLGFVTVTGNASTNKLGGGVQNVGGVTDISGSIVAVNASNSSDAKDCSGSPNLQGVNFIGNVQGCNPTGATPLIGDAGLGEVGDHGGATPSQPLLAGSRAIDAASACTVAEDQRGVARPHGGACDLGAFEVEPFGIELDLTTDVATIGAGAAVIPNGRLLDVVAAPAGPAASPLRSVPLRSVLVESVDFDSVPLRSVDAAAAPLRSVPLRSVPLRSIFAAFAPLRSIPLRSVPLRSILLSEVTVDHDGGWEALLADTPLQDVPLQTITLADVAELENQAIDDLTLDDVDLGSTRIGSLSLVSILLGSTPLRSVELDDGRTLCDVLGDACVAEWFTPETTVLTADLAGAPLRSVPLRSILLASLDLADAPLRSIPLRSIELVGLAPGSVGTIVLCDTAAFDCDAEHATVGDAFDAGVLRGTMADLLLAIAGEENLSWEDVDLSNGGLGAVADPPEPGLTYTADVRLRGGVTADLALQVTLPDGFVAVPGSVELDGAPIADPPFADQTLDIRLDDVRPGDHQVSFVAKAGVVLGEQAASATVTATAPAQAPATATDSVSTVVVGEAFEASTPADDKRALVPGALHLAHISAPDDVDLYEFTVTPAQAARGATISILLANLAADFDLALYGPPAVALRGDVAERRDMLPDHLVDLQPGDDHLTAEPTADVPQTLPFPSSAVIHRIAARREMAPESIEAIGLRAGTYWIQVSGANGASSAQPYVLRTQRTPGVDRGPCTAEPLTGAPTSRTSSLPPDLDTLFLVNARRFVAAYGAAGEEALEDVASFAASRGTGFVGGVLYVDTISRVQEAYVAWDADRCRPEAANDVVREIGAAVDAVASTHPNLANVVVVGDDAQIPMARVVDNTVIANERTFADEFDEHVEMVAALGGGFVLTDNALATNAPIGVNDHEVFAPTLAVGRLVETPAEIRSVLDSYTAAGGLLDPGTALVTGYDFLADGAEAIADGLGMAEDAPDRLINETWDSEDLRSALGATRRGLASINAHFDHYRALPAEGNATGDESDLFEAVDIASVAARLESAVLFSMGCHSGLNVSDIAIGDPRDWAQTLAGAGAHWIANTGYGYGDTETIALSEELMATFAARLVAGDPVGVALSAAKRQYLGLRPLVSSYDEKVVHESVLYGLPMLRLGEAEPAAGLRTLAAAAPASPLDVEPLTGLPAAPAAFEFRVASDETAIGPDLLTPRTTPEGSYYHVDGETLTQSRRPIQPLSSKDVTRPGERAQGFLVTGLQSLDLVEFDPLFFSPTVDLGDHEPRAVAADATFPSTLAALTATVGPEGREDRLVVAPGQYRRTAEAGTGTQRLFTQVEGVVYYGDAEPAGPEIGVRRSTSTFETDRVRFEVDLDHPGRRVYVLYKLLDTTTVTPWHGIDLVPTPGATRWVGQGPAAGSVEYVIQVVDADGRVVKADRKGDNFGSINGAVGELDIQLDPEPAAAANGWNTSSVEVSISAFDGAEVGTIFTSVDGGPYATYAGPFHLDTDGAHTVYAVSSEGYSATRIVLIDTQAPTVTAGVDPPAAAAPDWNRTGVTVSAAAADAGGSGVDTLTVAIDGGDPEPVDGPIAIAGDGEHSVLVTATDRAGNLRSTTVAVRVDAAAPTLSCPQGDGAWHPTNVTVTCVAADPPGGSGLVPASRELSTNIAAGSASASASAGTATACDVAGNCTTATSAGHRVDRADPVATITSPVAGTTYAAGSVLTASFGCTDQGSGVASCVGRIGTTIFLPGDPLPTGTGGTATLVVTASDNVGRVATSSVTYTVFAYAICPTYDELQPNLIGSTIPIKLQLCDAAGRNLSSSSIEVRAVTIDGTTLPPPNFVGNTNFGNAFRFGQKSYIYNLDTGKLAVLPAGTHTMELSVDGVRLPIYRVRFTLR